LRRVATTPASARPRSIPFRAARASFFRPKARAISRTPALPWCVPMKATRSSRDGRLPAFGLVRVFFKVLGK
jgi:hypothetical protein